MSARPLDICVLGSARDIHVATRTRALAARGNRVTMVSPRPGEIAGVEVIAPADGTGRIAGLCFTARKLCGRRPDVFYAHYASEYVCWLAALLGCRPLAIHAMGSDVLLDGMGKNGALRAWLTRRALGRASLLTVKSPFITETLRGMGISGNHIHEVLWGVDPGRYRWDEKAREIWRREWGVGKDAHVVLSPRPLEALYRQHLLVEALPRILAARPETYVMISEYGQDAAYRREMENRASALGVSARLRFLAGVSADKMPGLLSAADVMASLAYTDGTPQTVLEAQAVGVPVLMADIPDLRHVFTHDRDCWMVDADADAIAHALTGPLSDAAHRERIIAGGKKLVHDRANFPKDVARVESLLRGIAGGAEIGTRSRK